MDERQINVSQRSNGGAPWLNVLLGIWVIISPFILAFGPSPVAVWNNVATGGAVTILALISTTMPRQPGWSWTNMLLGIWLLVSPFALGFASATVLWNNVILGIIIAVVGWANAANRAEVRA
jgi:SPW repeat